VNAFEATGLHFTYRGARTPAIENVSLAVPVGGVFALLGPNGSGKSTLLRILLGALSPDQGEVRFQGKAVADWNRREFARQVGVVTQHEEMVFPLTVRELVSMGRYPHLGALRAPGREDAEATERAMTRCEVADLSERPISTLSGGERQRARLARALAQEPRVFVLDEPTAALDMAYEMEIFDLLRRLASEDGATVLLVTHHLNLAARFAGTLLLLRKGRVAGVGDPAEVLRQTTVEDVFEWPVSVVPHLGPGPDTGAPQIVPLARPTTPHPPSPPLE
jgi:iron complex transport system ATP-binding protein